MTARVGLVVVSHSARLAEGVVEVAAQMAPEVTAEPAGGLPDGSIGTDFDAVATALARADAGAGVVVLYDLGSARMVAELAIESLAEPARAVLVDAPLVTSAVAAAVAAQGGAGLAEVATAARNAGHTMTVRADRATGPEPVDTDFDPSVLRLTLHNETGLHARPAALLARTLSDVDATVTVRCGDREADATSVLALMSLGARHGDELEFSATGVQVDEALRRVVLLAARGFDDLP